MTKRKDFASPRRMAPGQKWTHKETSATVEILSLTQGNRLIVFYRDYARSKAEQRLMHYEQILEEFTLK